jgi:hypothetical protein
LRENELLGGLIRSQPLVMLSSTIEELRDVRSATAALISEQDVATPWAFELHAAASGERASLQYLRIARNCDVFVLLVSQIYSPATVAEYEIAYRDNPNKIVPIFIGRTPPELEELRLTISSAYI